MAGTSNYPPYEPNAKGFTEALIDFKDTLAGRTVYSVAGFESVAFENVNQGQPLYARSSDGKLGLARAAGNIDEARVVGFADAAASAGSEVKVLVAGMKTMSGIDAGDLYFLSPTTAGAITTTAPTGSGQAVTRVGEGATSTSFSIYVEPPVKLA